MKSAKTLIGTWEHVKQHDKELAGKQVRLTLLASPSSPTPKRSHTTSTSGRGLLSFLSEGSEQFAQRKQAEIAKERR